MDHEDRDLVILGLVETTGVEVVDLAVFDSGVWHFCGISDSFLLV